MISEIDRGISENKWKYGVHTVKDKCHIFCESKFAVDVVIDRGMQLNMFLVVDGLNQPIY